MQESGVESADRALREARPQIYSQRMELYQANQSSDHSPGERKVGSVQNWRTEKELFSKLGTLQEVEEFQKVLLYRS